MLLPTEDLREGDLLDGALVALRLLGEFLAEDAVSGLLNGDEYLSPAVLNEVEWSSISS